MNSNPPNQGALWHRPLRQLLDVKAEPSVSSADRKHARSINVIAFIGILIFVPWIPIAASKGPPWLVAENLVFILCLSAIIVINKKGAHFWAAFSMALLGIIQSIFSVYTFGFASQSHLFYLFLIVAPYLIFTRPVRVVAHIFAVLAAVALVLCFVVSDSLHAQIILIDVEEQALTNVVIIAASITAMAFGFVRLVDGSEDELLKERMRSERLLLNVLPQSIADRLKENPGEMIADRHSQVTIMFADVVGFTELSSRNDPPAIVKILSEVFGQFDEICNRHGVEKIRTMGDGYMAIAGAPEARPDHALAVARAAIEIREYMASEPVGEPLKVRIGINTGEIVSGIVGRSRFHFDAWGDAVNVAARMESTSEAGRIQVAEPTWKIVHAEIECVSRGLIDVKGKGQMPTWFVA